jgi:hypothetical protein
MYQPDRLPCVFLFVCRTGRVRTSYSKTCQSLLNPPPPLAHTWLASQIIDTLPPISDVGAPINYLESSVLIATNLAGIHASCRTVVLNATYRDFGTTHIPPALA